MEDDGRPQDGRWIGVFFVILLVLVLTLLFMWAL